MTVRYTTEVQFHAAAFASGLLDLATGLRNAAFQARTRFLPNLPATNQRVVEIATLVSIIDDVADDIWSRGKKILASLPKPNPDEDDKRYHEGRGQAVSDARHFGTDAEGIAQLSIELTQMIRNGEHPAFMKGYRSKIFELVAGKSARPEIPRVKKHRIAVAKVGVHYGRLVDMLFERITEAARDFIDVVNAVVMPEYVHNYAVEVIGTLQDIVEGLREIADAPPGEESN